LPFLLESLSGEAVAVDVEGEAGLPAVKGSLLLADTSDGSPHLP